MSDAGPGAAPDGDAAADDVAAAAELAADPTPADIAPSGGAAAAGRPGAVLAYLAGQLVDDPAAVVVEASPGRSGTLLSLNVAPTDMGRVIGRRGRTAQAIRTVVRAAAAAEGTDVSVDIVD